MKDLKLDLNTYSGDKKVYDIEKTVWRSFWHQFFNFFTVLVFIIFILLILIMLVAAASEGNSGGSDCNGDGLGECLWGMSRGILFPFWYLMEIVPFRLSEEKIRRRG